MVDDMARVRPTYEAMLAAPKVLLHDHLDGGLRPMPSGGLVGDQGSGLAAAFAICAAVLSARRTGHGECIDVSIADLLASWVAPMGAIDDRRAATSPRIEAPGSGVFCAEYGLPVAPVLTRVEMLEHPHFIARGVVTTDLDGRRVLGHPIRYRNNPALPPGPVPAVDQHHGEGFAPAS